MGIDIDDKKYGWIIDEEYHLRKKRNNPGGDALHPEWEKAWDCFFDKKKEEYKKIFCYREYEISEKEVNELKKTMREDIINYLENVKKNSRFRPLLSRGKQATVSYREWKNGVREIVALLNSNEGWQIVRKGGKYFAKTVVISSKVCKCAIVVTFFYNAVTNSFTYAVDNFASDALEPFSSMFDEAKKQVETIYDKSIMIHRQFFEQSYEVWKDPMNANPELLRPPYGRIIKDRS